MSDSVIDLARLASRPADPQAALAALARLRERLAELEDYHVEVAVARGASWSEIGEALGVSKQAAHKRFSGRLRRERPRQGRWMTVTGTARTAVQLGRSEAAAAGSRLAGPEHLLLGLLALQGGEAAQVLERGGVELDAARRLLGVRAGSAPGHAEISARGRTVLEHALGEAVRLQHEELSDIHLLFALLHHGGAPLRRLLAALGTTPEALLGEFEELA